MAIRQLPNFWFTIFWETSVAHMNNWGIWWFVFVHQFAVAVALRQFKCRFPIRTKNNDWALVWWRFVGWQYNRNRFRLPASSISIESLITRQCISPTMITPASEHTDAWSILFTVMQSFKLISILEITSACRRHSSSKGCFMGQFPSDHFRRIEGMLFQVENGLHRQGF
jgi:hypothetical protein